MQQCHGGEMRDLAEGAVQIEPAVPFRRQSALEEFSSTALGG